MTNNGAITLECPACGRVFLTLQQGGTMEICPHCANSAPRSAYFAIPAPVEQRDATPLPQRKPEQVAPVTPIPFSQVPPDSFPQAPQVPQSPQPPPEPAWQGIPTTPSPEAPTPAAASFFRRASAPPPASFAPAPEIPPAQPQPFAPAPAFENPAAPVTEPSWPGLGPTVTAAQESAPAAKAARTPVMKSGAPTRELAPSGPDAAATTPPKAPSRANGLMLFLLFVAIAFIAWFLWFQPEQVKVPVPEKGSKSVSPATAVETVPATVPATPKAEPPIETRRAIPAAVPQEPSPAPPQASNVADLIKTLDAATATDDRLKVIANPSQNRESMETFFNEIGGHLNPVRIEAGPVITEFSTGKDSPLYRLVTAKCPSGAVVRLPSSTNSSLIDWPFFVQTHSLVFDQFASPNAPEEPKTKRFTLLMQRSRDFELPEPERSTYDSFLTQGSMSAAGTVRVYVARDSAAGRLLATRMVWGKTYLVDALLGHAEIGGKTVLAVLECEDGIGSSQ